MFNVLLTIIITYFIVSTFGYIVHKSLHFSFTKRFNVSHMVHHLKMYPSGDYLSSKYRSAGKDDTFWTFALLSVPVVLTPIILGFLGIPLLLVAISLFEMLFLGWLNNYLHTCFHIKNHWLSRFFLTKYYFNKWSRLHEIHHDDMYKNYGIFSFFLDRLFGTYKAFNDKK